MANKKFSDLLAQAGYNTKRADNPAVIRERQDTGLGSGYSSESSGSDQGPSCLFEDDVNGKLVKPLAKQDNDVAAQFEKERRTNPFTDPSVDTPTTVKEATGNRRVKVLPVLDE